MSDTPLLQMRGISKKFPGVVALDNVDFSISPGEVVALVGENGAGKSTLMKILGGVYQPDAGEMQIAGKPTTIRNVNDALRNGVAFIHQELNVLDNLDIAANVFLGREPVRTPLRLIDRKKIHADTEPYLKRLGLDVASRTRVDRLSIAQRQMVEIAKALSLNARLVIMDEPTSSLTLTETNRLLELVRELGREGVGIIYISHRLGEITQCADRVVVLRDGRNAGELKREEIDHDRLVNLMVGRGIKSSYTESKAGRTGGYFKVRNLSSWLHPRKSVSFDASQGEILGFAGLVGAGRSEMATTLGGLQGPVRGQVTLDGAGIDIRSPREAINSGIYLVPEDRRREGLITRMNIRENLTLPALWRHARCGLIQRSRERKTAKEQTESLQIKAPDSETLALNLSGGNQQKIVLGKWLAMQPKVMILDEPTRGVDVGAKAEIYRLMRQLAERGAVVIMISSDMEEILNVSDRIAVMHEGSITGVLERPDCSEENVMQLAVGRTLPCARPAFGN